MVVAGILSGSQTLCCGLQAVGKGVTGAPVTRHFTVTCLIPLLAVLSSACGSPAYKLVNVPHCKVAEGAGSASFNEGLRWIYKSGNGGGTGPVSGDRPILGLGVGDSVDSEPVLAVVSCPKVQPSNISTVSSNSANPGADLTAKVVPTVCPGQEVVFHDTLKATDDAAAKAKGYDGVIRFPDIALTCSQGTLTKTTSADIEQRPK